ncbi:hypothetical protein AX16_002421 [Volvariella volvacea WC 439]|nr:hypothetical protein AX16_002421 [Volvariella volvacea WC 439]
MKFTLVSLFALALVQAVSAAPAPDATVDEVGPTATAKVHATHTTLEKRAVVATVTADALRYRTCPRTSCTAVGQYPRGTRVTVECFTTTNTTPVNGDP